MQSGMAQAMKEQAQLTEEITCQYLLRNFEVAAAIQRRLAILWEMGGTLMKPLYLYLIQVIYRTRISLCYLPLNAIHFVKELPVFWDKFWLKKSHLLPLVIFQKDKKKRIILVWSKVERKHSAIIPHDKSEGSEAIENQRHDLQWTGPTQQVSQDPDIWSL